MNNNWWGYYYFTLLDPPDCQYGFLSVERMRSILGTAGIKPVGSRQQITPDMKFTCDGMITTWIVGARLYPTKSLFPEFQIWRNNGSSEYMKISGRVPGLQTIIFPRIIQYSVLPPMPVQSGDILGIFIPNNSRLSLLSETTNSPTNYYLPTENSEESSLEIVDLGGNLGSLMRESYHPLVSVVIGECIWHSCFALDIMRAIHMHNSNLEFKCHYFKY